MGGRYGDCGWFAYARDENTDFASNAIPDDLFAS